MSVKLIEGYFATFAYFESNSPLLTINFSIKNLQPTVLEEKKINEVNAKSPSNENWGPARKMH